MAESDGIRNVVADGLTELLLERVSSAIALFDRDMRYIGCNRRWITDYKLGDTDLVGKSHLDLFPDHSEKWQILHGRALAGEKLSHDLDHFHRGDGTVAWVRWSMAPWRGKNGEIDGVLMVSEVLTPQIEKELRARVLSEELSLFVDIAENFALCMLDNEGRVTIWNSGTERVSGWKEAEALGRDFAFMFDPADVERGLPAKQLEIARRDGTFRDRCWRVRKDGSRFLADVTISRVDGDEQLPPGFGQIVRDVTEEDTRSRSLEASAVLLRSILETVADAMIVIDVEGIILSFNKAAETLFGYSAGEVVGRNVSMLMPSPDREQHDGYIARYLKTGERHILGSSRRVTGMKKDGTTFPHELRVGEAIGGGQRLFTGFVRDLTQQEEAEARLQELQREINHIGRVSEMGTLATAMAHELNQPLMAISNLVQTSADLITDKMDSRTRELAKEALGDAGREALRAGAIVKRLRSFVSRGELERTIENPHSLINDARELLASEATQRNIQLSIDVAEHADDILVDRVQIQQVLVNLMKNAIDSLGKDGIVRLGMKPEGSMMAFSVVDDGPGVPANRVERLFEPFSTSKPDGMGMGLSICRTIIEAHGGKIWYEDAHPSGAAFHFTVPRFRKEEADGD